MTPEKLAQRCRELNTRLIVARKQIASLKMELGLQKAENERLRNGEWDTFLAGLKKALVKAEEKIE